MMKALESFRPLAGFWFLNAVYPAYHAGRNAGFRPLAGFWFLNTQSPLTV